jgi:hypothetical protein
MMKILGEGIIGNKIYINNFVASVSVLICRNNLWGNYKLHVLYVFYLQHTL